MGHGAFNLIGRTDEKGIRNGGHYPLLVSALGANSQDPENADTRFSAFTDGRSQIGTQSGEAFNLLRLKALGETPGPLPRLVVSLRPTDSKKKKKKKKSSQTYKYRVYRR